MNTENMINHTPASFCDKKWTNNNNKRLPDCAWEAGERDRRGKTLKLTDLKIPRLSINTFVFGFVLMRFSVPLKDIPVIPLLTKRARRPSLLVSLIQSPQKCQCLLERPSAPLWWLNAGRMKCPLRCHSSTFIFI